MTRLIKVASPGRTIGAGRGRMRCALAAILLVSLALATPAQGAPESAIRSGEVSVPMDTGGHIPAVEVRINGTGPWRLLVDAREGDHLIDDDIARRLSLRAVEGSTGGEEGPASAREHVRLGDLELGELRLGDLDARIADLSEIFGDEDAPDGVLSLQAFGDHLITLDFTGDRLVVSDGHLPASGDPHTIPYTLGPADDGLGEGKVPVFPVRVADRRFDARLAFGLGGRLLFPLDDLEKVPVKTAPSVIGVARTGEGHFTIQGATVDGSVTLGGHAIEDCGVRFSEVFSSVQIGSHLLKDFAVTFDPSRRLVRFRRGASDRLTGIGPLPEIASLDPGGKPLREAFNDDRDKVRLVLILSPT